MKMIKFKAAVNDFIASAMCWKAFEYLVATWRPTVLDVPYHLRKLFFLNLFILWN